ncbi:hypothetical protein HELRODRAFT_169435 [Helobdella robusta]|uniref:Uncharacterized protein n=1 Tax=Helobdella robusta TaxID=6412 RepID=T1F1X6_HELRO|nr:hypothetical protein HELRODRAFT_169435 [Helobdella robusta]ESO08561.1 hypothetical protein HELRODRAFT_169435 [Helobdella robusta]
MALQHMDTTSFQPTCMPRCTNFQHDKLNHKKIYCSRLETNCLINWCVQTCTANIQKFLRRIVYKNVQMYLLPCAFVLDTFNHVLDSFPCSCMRKQRISRMLTCARLADFLLHLNQEREELQLISNSIRTLPPLIALLKLSQGGRQIFDRQETHKNLQRNGEKLLRNSTEGSSPNDGFVK